jgi:hypothetical protein
MNSIWKIWNYRGKRRTLAWFVLCCLGALAYGIIFCLWPEPPSFKVSFWFPISMTALGIILACFFGYRAFFFSDDWFRMKEEREARWWNEHPRLSFACSVLIWGLYFSVFVLQACRAFIRK